MEYILLIGASYLIISAWKWAIEDYRKDLNNNK